MKENSNVGLEEKMVVVLWDNSQITEREVKDKMRSITNFRGWIRHTPCSKSLKYLPHIRYRLHIIFVRFVFPEGILQGY